MAGSRVPGPVCPVENPIDIDEGTSCLTATPTPGSVNPGDSTLASVTNFFTSEYDVVKADLATAYDEVADGVQSNYRGARCLFQACLEAEDLAPAAILKETGYELGALLKGLIPGLLQMIVVVAATTLLGAAIGGIIGAFAGGVGALPGAVVGGELGMDAGVAVLTWLGVAFLAVAIVKGIGEMLAALRQGVELAWQARNLDGPAEQSQVTQAAQQLARSVGILMRLILQAIVAYLLKKAAMNATRGLMTTAGALKAEGAAAVSDATVAELVGRLRSSRLGGDFADWVEDNWKTLVKDPRLKDVKVADVGAKAGAGGSGGAAGDSAASKPPTSPKPKADPDPAATELEDSEFNGVKADRVRPGTNDKVAVIGRSMKKAVNPYADGLSGDGYNVETFEPSPEAQREWSLRCDEYPDGRIPNDEVPDTLSFQENQAWANKLADQGYTVVDVDNPSGETTSPFYEMEKQTLFGDSGGSH
jgi:hypothetical protein